MEEKKERQNNKINKKNIIRNIIYIIIIFFLIAILIFLFQKNFKNKKIRKSFEESIISFSNNNKETIFTINKVVFFSSSDSKNKTSSISNFTIENLYTYTDIALFINNKSKEDTLENTLKKLKISNIKFENEPKIGQPNIYYKSINNFAKSIIEEENKIEKELEFKIESENETDLNKPVLYNNCANPITLSYINQNIKTDYTMTDTQNPITYNGTLLKRCNVLLDTINTRISFNIEIENNKNQKFRTKIYLDIPYQDKEKSIYDGNLTIKDEVNFNFYRYE